MPRKEIRNDRRLKWGDGWIEERTTKDGSTRYRARWFEPGLHGESRKRSQTFPTEKAAELHLQTVTDAIGSGRYVAASDLTVAQLIDQWIARGSYSWKPSTVAVHRQKAKSQIVPEIGALKAVDLDTPRVQHWIDKLRRKGYAPNTIDKAVQTLHGAFAEAVRLGIVGTNPVKGVSKPSIQHQEFVTWSAADVQRVMSYLADDPLWLAVYRLALTTGMRPGELRVLKWADVNLASGVVTVRRTMTKNELGRQIVGTTTKTGRHRAVAIVGPVVAALNEWRKVQIEVRLAATRWHDGDFIFTSKYGRILSQREWQDRLKEIIAATGVPTITLHGLRHSSASLELEAGTHPKIVGDRLGHRSIRTTLDIYTHLSVDLQRAAAEALGTRLFGESEETKSS